MAEPRRGRHRRRKRLDSDGPYRPLKSAVFTFAPQPSAICMPTLPRYRPPALFSGPLRVWGLFLLPLLLVACDPSEPELPGTVRGGVSGEGMPLAGVVVELTGPLNRVTETDASGQYRFEQIPPGAYVVSIRNLPIDAAFPAVSRTASVSAGSEVLLDFQGNFIRTASVTGAVLARGRGVPGVRVSLAGPDQGERLTGADGSFTFPALRAGAYQVEISAFPDNLTFSSVRATANLQPGEARSVLFDGRPELTATLAIRSVSRVLASGERIPADLRNIQGLIEVAVVLDRGQDTPDSLVVLLGGKPVASQRFGEGGAQVSGPAELLFAIQTDAHQVGTGEPLHRNGETLLTARLATREGGEAAFSASAQVRLQNQDGFRVRLTPEKGPVLGEGEIPWVGGRLEAEVTPVIFSSTRSVVSVTLELRTRSGLLVAQNTVVGNVPQRIVFPVTAGSSGSLDGYVTPPGEENQWWVSQARYADGSLVVGLPQVIPGAFRVDQRAPMASTFQLPRQNGTGQLCCLDNWVGSDLVFAAALSPVTDEGVGQVTTRFHAGAALLSDEELLALPPVSVGSDLPATAGNAAYRMVAVLEDALGLRRLVPLTASAGNPLQGGAGAVFGVDRTPPTIALGSGGSTLPARAVNPPPSSAWAVTLADGESGLGSLPVLASVRHWGPSSPEGGACLFPADAPQCTPRLTSLLRPLPESPSPGYLRFQAQGVDRAGNRSTAVEAWALVDTQPPTVGEPFLLTPLRSQSEARVGFEATDDVDLHRARLFLRFGSGGEAALHLPAPAPARLLGVPFRGVERVALASAEISFLPFLALQSAGSGPTGRGAGGEILPLSGVRVDVTDAAGNRGTRSLGAAAPTGFQPRGFQTELRGAEAGVVDWRLSASEAAVCSGTPGAICPSGVPTSIRLEAVARGQDPTTFNAPFTRVLFLLLGEGGEWVGTAAASTRLEGDAEGGGAGARWVLDWAPGAQLLPDAPAQDRTLVAVGVDAEGNALSTSLPLTIRVYP
jgi:hypothetical protein